MRRLERLRGGARLWLRISGGARTRERNPCTKEPAGLRRDRGGRAASAQNAGRENLDRRTQRGDHPRERENRKWKDLARMFQIQMPRTEKLYRAGMIRMPGVTMGLLVQHGGGSHGFDQKNAAEKHSSQNASHGADHWRRIFHPPQINNKLLL